MALPGSKISKLNSIELLIAVIAIGMVIYQMIYTQYLLQATVLHYNTHLGLALAIVFLASSAKCQGIRRFLSLLAAVASVVATGYVHVLNAELAERAGFNTSIDLVIGALLILLTLESTRQSFGLSMPLIIAVVIVYPFVGPYLPEPLYTSPLSIPRTISNLSIGLSGIYGTILSVSANYVFLFIVFGTLLQTMGATRFFIQIGRLFGRTLRGGPGLTAVVSSSLIGMVTGSVAGNVAVVGSFTIPLMKRVGYKPEQAAAIEAASSNGGQIMPPVMGITAFAMAAITGIPYLKIVVMAVIPALLYYLTCGTYVQLQAMKNQVSTSQESVDVRDLFFSAPLFLLPLLVIVALLVGGFSVMYVAFWAVISIVLIGTVRKRGQRPSLRKIIDGFAEGAKSGSQIAVMCAAMGLLVETLATSGLAVKLAAGMEVWSGGNLFVALVLTEVICVIMGMGGLSMSAYIIVSIFAAPALLKMGVGLAESHFFVMFASSFAYVTPPVALAALVAAKMAGAGYAKTAIETVKVSFAAFFLPFAFIYLPVTLLQPQEPVGAMTGLVALVVGLISIEVFFVGHALTTTRPLERALALVSAVSLFASVVLQAYVLFAFGIGLTVLFAALQFRRRALAQVAARTEA